MTWGNRWEWEHTRQSTAGLLKLDVRRLKRDGALRAGAVCSIGWGEGQTIMTAMNRHGDCLTLDYRTKRYGDTEWTPHTFCVWLDWTPCHYGGERIWFRCPRCQSRRAVLFMASGVFRCRGCHDLAYQSTREDAIDRAGRRITTLQRKLKAAPGSMWWTIPEKPAGMHWQTYDRLASELRIAIARRDALFGAALDALEARTVALLSERGG